MARNISIRVADDLDEIIGHLVEAVAHDNAEKGLDEQANDSSAIRRLIRAWWLGKLDQFPKP